MLVLSPVFLGQWLSLLLIAEVILASPEWGAFSDELELDDIAVWDLLAGATAETSAKQ